MSTEIKAPSLESILKKTVAPSAWVEFKEGIVLQLKFMPKSQFKSLADKHTDLLYDPVTKVRQPRLNTKAFTKAFIGQAIIGWRGLTLRSLSKISEVDISAYDEASLDTPIEFSADECATLIDMVYDLDQFINSAVTDIKTFRSTLEEEAKNSKASQPTS